MVYINQEGQTELGRGETIEAAIDQAIGCGFELTFEEIKTDAEQFNAGDVYSTDLPVDGYNDAPKILQGEAAIDLALRDGLSIRKYADPIEGARSGVSPFDAREIVAIDSSLIYVEVV